jgi:LPS sulfotransferase NodH
MARAVAEFEPAQTVSRNTRCSRIEALIKPFVIVGLARSSSTLLLRALKQHPEIKAYGELFHWLEAERRAAYHAIHFRSATIGFDAANGDPLEFLREWVWGPSNSRFKAAGFKIFAQHAIENSSPDFFASLREEFPGLHVLDIRRPNYLDVLASWLMAQQTEKWFFASDSEPASAVAPAIAPTPDQAEAFFARMESADRFFADMFSGGAYLPVSYGDLSRDLQATCDRVFDFLGVEASPDTPSIRKQIERDLREIISSYRELAEYCSGTRFASFSRRPCLARPNPVSQTPSPPAIQPAIGSAPGRSSDSSRAARRSPGWVMPWSTHSTLKCVAADPPPVLQKRRPSCFPRFPYRATRVVRAAAEGATSTATAVPRSPQAPRQQSPICMR